MKSNVATDGQKMTTSKMGQKSELGRSRASQMSQSPSQVGTTTRGRPPARSRRIFLIVAIVAGIILLVAIVGLVVALMRKTRASGQTFYDKVCKKEFTNLPDTCLVGSQPFFNCSVLGECTRFVYRAKTKDLKMWKFDDASNSTEWKGDAKNLLCGTRGSLGVCSADGRCLRSDSLSTSEQDDLFGNARGKTTATSPTHVGTRWNHSNKM